MNARALSLAFVLAVARSQDLNLLPHSATFMKMLSTAAPYMTAQDIEVFIDQYAPHEASKPAAAPKRKLQSIELALPSLTDAVSPAAYDGWIHQQSWRNFSSAVGRPGSRGAKDDVTINYVTARCPTSRACTRGGVVVVVGHTEPAEKYAEQIFDLVDQGFSPVYALDHRGQGRSTRMLADGFKSHVEQAGDFVIDLRDFVALAHAEMTRNDEGHGKYFLHCHSMGCAISLTYLIEEYYAQRPNIFHAVAANAPLIKPVTDPFPYPVAVAIGQGMLALGLDESYPPTKGAPFEQTYCADATCAAPRVPAGRPDRQVIQYARCHTYRDVEYGPGHQGLCLGDVTARFAAEFFSMYDKFTEFAKPSLKGRLSIPILLQGARDVDGKGHDGIVTNAEQDAFCAHTGACTLHRYTESEHNIWFEKDAIRTPALEEAFAFYDQHASSVAQQKPLPRVCTWWEPWCGLTECESCIWSCSHPAARC